MVNSVESAQTTQYIPKFKPTQMSLLKKITPGKLVRLLKLSTPVSRQSLPVSVESLPEEGNGEISLERIKDLII